jgi:hypothetical protein
MRWTRWTECMVAVSLVGFGSPVGAATHDATVAMLQAMNTSTDCFFFILTGVTQADPVKPNDPWFAIPRTQNGAKDAYAMLLSAKVAGSVVQVQTTGQLACGYAAVGYVALPP